MPLIKETLSGISKARYFTKLDITAAFHKIRIAKGQKWITVFRTRYELFEYLVTPFGLNRALVTGLLTGRRKERSVTRTGYPARSRDRSCDRHTATATRSPPYGHRHTVTATRSLPHGHHHMATATRSPPHGHRHTVTATRPPPHGYRHTITATYLSYPWPGHVPGYVPGHVPGYVMSYMPGYVLVPLPIGIYQGPLTLGHFRWPLAFWYRWPLFPFGPRPFFSRSQYLLLTMANGGLCLLAAFSPYRPPIYNGL